MRMISQSLREESVDYSEPMECSRPWLRRRLIEQPQPEVMEAVDIEHEGVLHVAPQ